jgi:potassium-transporting ATPase KdpC subunit
MKDLIKSIKLHFATLILFGIFFSLLIWGIGQLFPAQSSGLPIYKNGKLVGFENIGQKFTKTQYFWGRPSAVDYNAASAGGSNKGPTNPEYLKLVQDRIDTLLKYNPGIKKSDIPADMVTTSGSGIDPHISVQAAMFQIPRIAKVRNIDEKKVSRLVESSIEKPLLGLFGPERVNVLKLNIKLDGLSQTLSKEEGY